MDLVYVVLGLTLLATLWFLPVGTIRLIAYHSGDVDHTRGMHNVARTILAIGLVSLVLSVILAVVVLTR